MVRAGTGIEGLDDVLCGGFPPHRLYLVEGTPGAGKTTLAFQFLMEGARRGERVLYITLSETRDEVLEVAASHGWDLTGVGIRELVPTEQSLHPDEQYSVFHPSEVELSDTTRRILEYVDAANPSRVVFDSLSELRLLAGAPLRYRRQILALKQYFAGRHCTVMMLDDLTAEERDLQVQSVAHGVVSLGMTVPDFGTVRRRLTIVKMRGSEFRGGFHDFAIRRGGLQVFPRLVAAEHRQETVRERLTSGIAEIDALLGGGLERGTSTLVQGAAGTGKSTLSTLFALQLAQRGEHAEIFLFDESISTLKARMRGLGLDLEPHIESGQLVLRQIDPAEMSPGELVQTIRTAVEQHDARMVVIDSLNGYLNSMPDEKFLVVQLHELLTYLGQHSVASVLVSAQVGLVSSYMSAPVDASYLADAVVLMRYFETEGEIRQAISVVKMRGGDHERTIREFRMRQGAIHVGPPLREFQGIFTGAPSKRASPA
jgi:circadian clock protein KaiC